MFYFFLPLLAFLFIAKQRIKIRTGCYINMHEMKEMHDPSSTNIINFKKDNMKAYIVLRLFVRVEAGSVRSIILKQQTNMCINVQAT